MTNRYLLPLLLGVLITGTLFVIAYLAHRFDLDSLGRAFFWQHTFLEMLVPVGGSVTLGQSVYDSTRLHFFTALASFPVGILVYGCASYFFLRNPGRSSI
jgi:hypothetical protein